jgi:hypothetical protein
LWCGVISLRLSAAELEGMRDFNGFATCPGAEEDLNKSAMLLRHHIPQIKRLGVAMDTKLRAYFTGIEAKYRAEGLVKYARGIGGLWTIDFEVGEDLEGSFCFKRVIPAMTKDVDELIRELAIKDPPKRKINGGKTATPSRGDRATTEAAGDAQGAGPSAPGGVAGPSAPGGVADTPQRGPREEEAVTAIESPAFGVQDPSEGEEEQQTVSMVEDGSTTKTETDTESEWQSVGDISVGEMSESQDAPAEEDTGEGQDDSTGGADGMDGEEAIDLTMDEVTDGDWEEPEAPPPPRHFKPGKRKRTAPQRKEPSERFFYTAM